MCGYAEMARDRNYLAIRGMDLWDEERDEDPDTSVRGLVGVRVRLRPSLGVVVGMGVSGVGARMYLRGRECGCKREREV